MDSRGRIAAIGPDHSVPRPPGVPGRRFENAALIPGLVNVHTHLELTDLGGPLEAPTFYDWIQTIRRELASRDEATLTTSARRGLVDCWRGGITTVADTGSSSVVAPVLDEMFGRGIVYQEVFAPDPTDTETAFANLRKTYDRLVAHASERVTIGVSPHAPYTVSCGLYRRVAQFAVANNVPVAAHIAESSEESTLIRSGGGPFADAWKRRGIAPPPKAASPIQYLAQHGVLDTELLAIHCVQVDTTDCKLLATHDCAVATCPTSNTFHGHGCAPVRDMTEAGIRVAVGTDSVASVGSLDLFREGRALRQALNLSAAETVRLLTLDAAAVLKLERDIGTLAVGKWGDMTVIELQRTGESPLEQVVQASPAEVRATFVAGRCVYDARETTDKPLRGRA